MNWLHALLVAEIRAGLRANGWSQKQLAERAGITPKHLSFMLLGKTEGTLDMWSHLLLVVGRVQRFANREAAPDLRIYTQPARRYNSAVKM